MNKYISLIAMIVICMIMMVGCKSYSDDYDSNSDSGSDQSQNVDEVHQKLIKQAHLKGPESAKVTLIEISDFDCPACRNYHPEIKKIIDEYGDKIQFGFIVFPLSYHKNAEMAAYASEAADKQGKYWEVFEKFFSGDKFNPDEIENQIKELGIDLDQFNQDKNSEEVKQIVKTGMDLSNEIGLEGTPTFLINGEQIKFNPTYENLKKEIEQILNN